MKLRFPYGNSILPNFGIIVTIKFWLNVQAEKDFLPFSFLFDTGADISSLPVSAAGKLDIDLSKCVKEPMTGYEGTSVLVYRSQINIKFNKKILTIPCVFTPIEHVPILLGRAGILDKFTLTLDGKKKEIRFEEI